MKDYKELAQRVLERRDKYVAAKKQKRKKRIKYANIICGVAMVALAIALTNPELFGIEMSVNNPGGYHGSHTPGNSGTIDVEYDEPTTSVPVTTTPPPVNIVTTKPTGSIPVQGGLCGGEMIAQYALSGGEYVSDWVSDGDKVYMLIGGTNKCILLDTNSGQILCELSLAEKAVKIRVVGDELWVSVPSWKSVMIYDKSTLSLLRQMRLDTEIINFDVGEKYLVYTDSQQGGNLYRYELSTGKTIRTKNIGYYQPEILLDEKGGAIFLGDSGTMGGRVYRLNLETLTVQSRFIKDNYGYCNTQRKMFLADDGLYWGVYRLDKANVSKMLMSYASSNQQGIFSHNEQFTVLTNGVYLRGGKKVIGFDTQWTMAEITPSGNAVFAYGDGFYVLKNWSDSVSSIME